MKDSKTRKPPQEILIDDHYCKGCYLCVQVCPRKVFEPGGKRSRAGYPLPRVTHLEKCSSCLLCEMTCPDLCLTVGKEGN